MGGVWHPEQGYTWDNMTTNLSKYTCAFADYPLPPDTDVFPTARKFFHYIKQYSQHFGLDKYIKFRSQVQSVERNPSGTYTVTWIQKG